MHAKKKPTAFKSTSSYKLLKEREDSPADDGRWAPLPDSNSRHMPRTAARVPTRVPTDLSARAASGNEKRLAEIAPFRP